LASAEFAVNNKTHTVTKVLLFMANYGKEVRMGGDIRKKRKSRKHNGVRRKNEESS